MTKAEQTLSRLNGTSEKEYGALVTKKLRTRYSLSDELATLRKRDTHPDDFDAYNAFAEECKALAREEIFGKEENN